MCEHHYNIDDIPDVKTANDILKDSSFTIEKKMRALFFLRNIVTEESSDIIAQALYCNRSILLLHEICYVLGQMRLNKSIPVLCNVLNDEKFDTITRHEAAEALGNYGSKDLIPILQQYLDHKEMPLRETCYISIKKIEEISQLKQNQTSKTADNIGSSQFNSRDPAIPLYAQFTEENLNQAIRILNEDDCLYQKYRAMFFLRDFDEFILEEQNEIAEEIQGHNLSEATPIKRENKKNASFDAQLLSNEQSKGTSMTKESSTFSVNHNLNKIFDQNSKNTSKLDQENSNFRNSFVQNDNDMSEQSKKIASLKNTAAPSSKLKNEKKYLRIRALSALLSAFSQKSALLKHELSFIIGQLRSKKAVPILQKVIDDKTEHSMVRHEAAAALGSIATPECKQLLAKYTNDPCEILKDSCLVALDVWEEENFSIINRS